MTYISSYNDRHRVTKTFTTLHPTTHAYIAISIVTHKLSYEIFPGLQINEGGISNRLNHVVNIQTGAWNITVLYR
jgi:hypothetical protein